VVPRDQLLTGPALKLFGTRAMVTGVLQPVNTVCGEPETPGMLTFRWTSVAVGMLTALTVLT
jgi:hypothetical protein